MMNLRRLAVRLRGSEDGVAAVEMSLVGGLFCLGLLNVAELSRYAFSSMEAANATQAGVAAALATCDVAHVPATLNCQGLNAAVASALTGTSLGSGVTINGQMTESYFCLNGSNLLVYVSGPTAPPADCSAVSNPTGKPALYLSLATSFMYNPMFSGLTVVDALPHTLSKTALTRMQ